ncbi:MAG: M15 family metallopeptidase, partial [Myxococcales bacterium]|nr:M15 family metallopeptidase [Myxococcales bacterium]
MTRWFGPLACLWLAACGPLERRPDVLIDHQTQQNLTPTPTATAPLPEAPAMPPAPRSDAHHLASLHPEVRAMALALAEQAEAAGVPIRFISGHRRFNPRAARARAGRASWHQFGMAIDLVLADRKGMADALDHYSNDRERWQTVGQIAKRLGFTWGLEWRREEVVHFEWHPGMPSAIRRPTLNALLALTGPDGADLTRLWA